MAFDHCPAQRIQAQHLAFATARALRAKNPNFPSVLKYFFFSQP